MTPGLFDLIGEAMKTKLMRRLALLAALSLLIAACTSDDEGANSGRVGEADSEPVETDDVTSVPLGEVVVAPGEAIQIRSLNSITGDNAAVGLVNQRAVELAVAHYGDVNGFDINLGDGLDAQCSAVGGQDAARAIAEDPTVVGVIGTSCSSSSVTAAPILGDAGLVMISPSATDPALTADQLGNPGTASNPGYYRTARNDLFQGQAMAEFLFNDLGQVTAAAIHNDDPTSFGQADLFAARFEELGGAIVGFAEITRGESDMVPVLTELAQGSPGALFLPVSQPEGDLIAIEAAGIAGLESATLLSTDTMLVDPFLLLEASEGAFFASPATGFGDNVNEATGIAAAEFLAEYEAVHGEAPTSPSGANAYDATTLLLDAVREASVLDGDTLVIDRTAVRQALNNVLAYSGLSGVITCDPLGDCAPQAFDVVRHDTVDDIEASKRNVVFSFTLET